MSQPRRVHVVGAGLAGLAAAVRLAEAGCEIVLYEAAPHAGGRCRSYLDATLGCRIDNGNHLLISGNWAVQRYLAMIGAGDSLEGPEEAAFPFLDLATGERWVLRPGAGRVPWWLLDAQRRVPGTRARDYLKALRLGWARRDQSVVDLLDRQTTIFRRLWRPLTVAILNTGVNEASASLLAHVLRESFAKGGGACRPLVPREGLSESFVDPALFRLGGQGAQIRFAARVRELRFKGDHVAAIGLEAGAEPLLRDEAVVLAVPSAVATRLVPDLVAPNEFRAIVNAHYRITLAGDAPLLVGVIGGMAEWVFRKREVLSVTVSAADRLVDMPAEQLGPRLWADVEQAYDLPPGPMPPVQIVKEKRATFAATPAQLARRPRAATRWSNLALAGDWTDTGLPATIEGAIRSGFTAAAALLGRESRAGNDKSFGVSYLRSNVASLPESRL